MTAISTRHNPSSSAENRRQLDQSIERAMDRYRNEFEAVRANSARLRGLREAHEQAAREQAAREQVLAPRPKRRRKA